LGAADELLLEPEEVLLFELFFDSETPTPTPTPMSTARAMSEPKTLPHCQAAD